MTDVSDVVAGMMPSAGELGFGGVMSSFVKYVTCCEEVIAERAEKEPLLAVVFDDSFRFLTPRFDVFDGFSVEVYRWHCNEILDRLVAGESVDNGTKAEVMCALSRVSQVAPPGNDISELYARLFAEWHPEDAATLPDSDGFYESWPGRAAELLAETRKKMAVKGRGEF